MRRIEGFSKYAFYMKTGKIIDIETEKAVEPGLSGFYLLEADKRGNVQIHENEIPGLVDKQEITMRELRFHMLENGMGAKPVEVKDEVTVEPEPEPVKEKPKAKAKPKKEEGKYTLKQAVEKCRTFAALEEIVESNKIKLSFRGKKLTLDDIPLFRDQKKAVLRALKGQVCY